MVVFGKHHEDRRHLLSTDTIMGEKQVDNAAFQHVRENIEMLNGRANDTDLIFLKGLMDSPVLRSLVKVQDRLEESYISAEPLSTGNVDLAKVLRERFGRSRNKDAVELVRLLKDPHITALVQTHDTIAERSYDPDPSQTEESGSELDFLPINGMADTIRMVGIRKSAKEPLGLTVEVNEKGELAIARILGGGMIDRQGLLHAGDVIREVNGVQVYSPEDLQLEIAKARESVTLKVSPTLDEFTVGAGQVKNYNSCPNSKSTSLAGIQAMCYMRALFDYHPKEDTLLPCSEIGLTFTIGDILQIVNQSDPNWWQARKIGSSDPAGLIPSRELEERRKAFVRPEADFVHKIGICGTRVSRRKKKSMYLSKSNSDFDKAELLLYEEVTKMPPFKRKTLALIGSNGTGRRTLKNRLINSDPDSFGTIIPHTSRPVREFEDNGKGYWFVSREEMEDDIRHNKYLEFAEHQGHLYGTKMDSIRNVIKQGKMCILDCSPHSLKILHNSPEFMPYVIFLAAPGIEHLHTMYEFARAHGYSSRSLTFERGSSMRHSRRARTLESLASLYEEDDFKNTVEESSKIQRLYDKYFDLVIVNEDFDITFRKVLKALENLSVEHQWVPVSWVY